MRALCGEWMPRAEVPCARPAGHDGRHRSPADMARQRDAALLWHHENLDRAHENNRRWREENPEKQHERVAQWHQENLEQARGNVRRWHQENLERRHEENRLWRADHPENGRERERRRRAHKADQVCPDAGAGIHVMCGVSVEEAALIVRPHECWMCGKRPRSMSSLGTAAWPLEHIMPISRGGLHCIENAAWSCRDCNLWKNDSTVEEMCA